MLCRHKIKSPGGIPPLPGTLVSCKTLASYSQAVSVLEQAKTDARQILEEATQQREDLLEQAGLEMWHRASAQLKRWDLDRQALCDDLERYASSIANQAVYLLLEEAPHPQRMAAMIKQLLARHVPMVKATLLCHPMDLECVKACLVHRGEDHWTLRPDNAIKPQTLVLNTEEGDFRINWPDMCNAFMTHEDSPPDNRV